MTLTPAQLAIRPDKLTGSTTAAYLGLNPHTRPSEAWEQNEGLREFQGNASTEAGNDFEAAIGARAKRELEIPDLEDCGKSIIHPRYPEMIVVHPDWWSLSEKLNVQIKNHESPMARIAATSKGYRGKPTGGWDNELIPLHVHIQIQLEMATLAAYWDDPEWGECSILAAHFGGSATRYYWIKRDAKLLKGILHAGEIFWRQHLNPKGPKTRPSDEHWVGGVEKYPRRTKLPPEAMSVAPMPFSQGLNIGPISKTKIPF